MSLGRQRGASLAIGLILLSLVTLLGLAGANGAHVEQLLAQNESFRENAASAASAGIEVAIRAIVNSPAPESVVTELSGQLPGSAATYQATIRFAGLEQKLPQLPGAALAGAHFEIVSTGYSARHAVDRQRVDLMQARTAAAPVTAADCEPLASRPCILAGAIRIQSWQRLATP
jgi:hypothetical protein